ncbi:MAG: immune inhibitor A [Bacteroidales bacterium]|nr:immune inhibitor A [Bacteroidales bacterium]
MLKTLAIILSVFNTLLIPVQFKDTDMVSTDAQIQDISNKCAAYFTKQFSGEVNYSISVGGCITLDSDISYYGQDRDSEIDPFCARLVREACAKSDPGIDFNSFCNKEERVVDLVIFYVAGSSESDGDGTDFLWPQFSTLSGKGEAIFHDNCRIDNFIIFPELSQGSMAGAGRLCHEIGHYLGFPDLYDTDGSGSGGSVTDVIGTLSLMGGGYLNGSGGLPPSFTAVERELAGTGRCITAEPGEFRLNPDYEYLKLDSHVPGEYYLMEYNSFAGGLVIYYIDKSAQNAGWSDRFGRELTAAQRWRFNEVNCRPGQECARTSAGTFRFKDGYQAPLYVTAENTDGGQLAVKISEIACIRDLRAYQDGAAIRFSVNEEYGTIWKCTLEWHQEGLIRDYMVPSFSDGEYFAVLDGKLEPGKDCRCVINIYSDNGKWFTLEKQFKTSWWNKDSIPYMIFSQDDRNSDGSFIRGKMIPLKVFNLPYQNGTDWFFDGRKIDGGWIRLTGSGELRAEVSCPDSRTQVLVKEIVVK